MDQNATWEAARRLHTAQSNTPESATDLSMAYDEVSAYKAGSSSAGTPCWSKPPLASTGDSMSTVYVVSLDKSAGATDPSKWTATSAMGGGYQSCPSNPTP
jgi:hypothetical protein